MKKIKIAIICPSEIALRRFMPALQKIDTIEYYGIAIANEKEWFGKKSKYNDLNVLENEYKKAKNFQDLYGGKIFNSYNELIIDKEVDAIYIPLPPALHYKWAKLALENNKHVFLEKPSTISYNETYNLVSLAKSKNLTLHENYMFNFHSQIDFIEEQIKNKLIGNIRLIRISFGFPFRGSNDFRYNKKLGGGALLDCGGYTLKLATRLLGNSIKIMTHKLNYVDEFDVDLFGSGTLQNDLGQVVQVSFGMDNSYKCELEIWGSKGTLNTNRILTAPENFEPTIVINLNNEIKEIKLPSDDTFKKSINHFLLSMENDHLRYKNYSEMLIQSKLVDEFKEDKK